MSKLTFASPSFPYSAREVDKSQRKDRLTEPAEAVYHKSQQEGQFFTFLPEPKGQQVPCICAFPVFTILTTRVKEQPE